MPNILDTAIETFRDRERRYGKREDSFANVAKFWSVILGTEVTPAEVALCMIGLKIARQMFCFNEDNLVDIAGYAQCLNDLRPPTMEEMVASHANMAELNKANEAIAQKWQDDGNRPPPRPAKERLVDLIKDAHWDDQGPWGYIQ